MEYRIKFVLAQNQNPPESPITEVEIEVKDIRDPSLPKIRNFNCDGQEAATIRSLTEYLGNFSHISTLEIKSTKQDIGIWIDGKLFNYLTVASDQTPQQISGFEDKIVFLSLETAQYDSLDKLLYCDRLGRLLSELVSKLKDSSTSVKEFDATLHQLQRYVEAMEYWIINPSSRNWDTPRANLFKPGLYIRDQVKESLGGSRKNVACLEVNLFLVFEISKALYLELHWKLPVDLNLEDQPKMPFFTEPCVFDAWLAYLLCLSDGQEYGPLKPESQSGGRHKDSAYIITDTQEIEIYQPIDRATATFVVTGDGLIDKESRAIHEFTALNKVVLWNCRTCTGSVLSVSQTSDSTRITTAIQNIELPRIPAEHKMDFPINLQLVLPDAFLVIGSSYKNFRLYSLSLQPTQQRELVWVTQTVRHDYFPNQWTLKPQVMTWRAGYVIIAANSYMTYVKLLYKPSKAIKFEELVEQSLDKWNSAKAGEFCCIQKHATIFLAQISADRLQMRVHYLHKRRFLPLVASHGNAPGWSRETKLMKHGNFVYFGFPNDLILRISMPADSDLPKRTVCFFKLSIR